MVFDERKKIMMVSYVFKMVSLLSYYTAVLIILLSWKKVFMKYNIEDVAPAYYKF